MLRIILLRFCGDLDPTGFARKPPALALVQASSIGD